MTPRDAERRLKDIVEPLLARHGFTRLRRLEFLRRNDGRTDRIGFRVFADRNGTDRTAFGVGVRFDAVESCRPGERDQGAPTVGVPMHFLLADRKYFDWPLDGATNWDALSVDIADAIEKHALPFLHRFSTPDAIRMALESDDPRDWFTLDQASRIETLALIDCARGEREHGAARLSQWLAARADLPSKTRHPVVRLLEALGITPDAQASGSRDR